MGTLAVRLTLPLAGCVEDLYLLVSAPCRAHQMPEGPSQTGRAFFLRNDDLYLTVPGRSLRHDFDAHGTGGSLDALDRGLDGRSVEIRHLLGGDLAHLGFG